MIYYYTLRFSITRVDIDWLGNTLHNINNCWLSDNKNSFSLFHLLLVYFFTSCWFPQPQKGFVNIKKSTTIRSKIRKKKERETKIRGKKVYFSQKVTRFKYPLIVHNVHFNCFRRGDHSSTKLNSFNKIKCIRTRGCIFGNRPLFGISNIFVLFSSKWTRKGIRKKINY